MGFHALSKGPASDQNINSPSTIRYFLRKNFALNIREINNFYFVSARGRVERSKRLHRNSFLIMNEDDRRRIFKAKRKRQKKRRRERKKEEAKQARSADRQRRIQQEAERVIQARVDQGDLVVPTEKESARPMSTGTKAENLKKALIGKHGSACKRPSTQQQNQGPPEKTARSAHKHALKEISPEQITTKSVHLGSGSYGSCYLGVYRGMDVVVKELRVQQFQHESHEDAAERTVNELIYEARILNKLGDHPGLPLLFGVCSKERPYRLIMQFHGEKEGNSLSISSTLSKKTITDQATWTRIIVKTAEALAHVHNMGFLHNDLKSNNVVLDKKGGSYEPVIIDFGKSVPISGARGPKVFSEEKRYTRDFPHIAPEIVQGIQGQSVASDIFGFAKIAETIFKKSELGSPPHVVLRALNADPSQRPGLDEIVKSLS